jgi:hypothetical protein
MTLAQQRRYDVLASSIIFISTIVATIVSFYLRSLENTSVSRATVIIIGLFSLFLLLLAYFIRIGRRWAKFTYIAVTVLVFLPVVLDYHRLAATTFTSTAATAAYIAQQLCYVVVATLLILSLRRPTSELM